MKSSSTASGPTKRTDPADWRLKSRPIGHMRPGRTPIALRTAACASTAPQARKSAGSPYAGGSQRHRSASRSSITDEALNRGTISSPRMMLVVWFAKAAANSGSRACGHAKATHRTSTPGQQPPSRQRADSKAPTPAPNEWPQTTMRRGPPSLTKASSTASFSSDSRRRAALSMPSCAKPCTPPSSNGTGWQARSASASLTEAVPRKATTTWPVSWSTATMWPILKSLPRPSSKRTTSTAPLIPATPKAPATGQPRARFTAWAATTTGSIKAPSMEEP
mmetsp:Transcript_64196/g.139646  ORF Transcript_64196/g.139646 Transcript_64196/m.139646 type:complete len:278 (+) Transcript_64196:299-1132(+)